MVQFWPLDFDTLGTLLKFLLPQETQFEVNIVLITLFRYRVNSARLQGILDKLCASLVLMDLIL